MIDRVAPTLRPHHREMTTYTLVRTFWFGPLPWRGPEELTHELGDQQLVCELLGAKGLYQVVGSDPVHGPNTLLYVGVAGIRGVHGTIGARLADHWARWAQYEDGRSLAVHLGAPTSKREMKTIKDALQAPIGRDELSAVEALTIWWHSPVYNIKSKAYARARRTDSHLLVQSWGDRGRLAMEYSSDWDLHEPPGENDADEPG